VPIIDSGTWPVRAIIGIESSLASAMAVTRLVAPGPLEARQTSGRPETRAMPWAMKPAPCSWRHSTWWIVSLLDRASYMGRAAPPGTPAIVLIPCRSSSLTIRSAPVICIIDVLLGAWEPYCSPGRGATKRQNPRRLRAGGGLKSLIYCQQPLRRADTYAYYAYNDDVEREDGGVTVHRGCSVMYKTVLGLLA